MIIKHLAIIVPGDLSNTPFPWESEIGNRVTAGDCNWYAPGMLNKIGKEGKTSWDSFTYGIPMSPMFICILEQYKKQTV